MSAVPRNAERTFNAVPLNEAKAVVMGYVQEYLAGGDLATDMPGRWHAAFLQLGLGVPSQQLVFIEGRMWGLTALDMVAGARIAVADMTNDVSRLAHALQRGYGKPLLRAESTWSPQVRIGTLYQSATPFVDDPRASPGDG